MKAKRNQAVLWESRAGSVAVLGYLGFPLAVGNRPRLGVQGTPRTRCRPVSGWQGRLFCPHYKHGCVLPEDFSFPAEPA